MTARKASAIADHRLGTLLVGLAAGVAACSIRTGVPIFIAVICAVPLLWYAFSVPDAWIRAFFAASLLLPPLALAWGDSGPHPAVAFAIVGAVAVLIRGDDWRHGWSAVNVAMACYLAALAFSVGFAAIYSGAVIASNSAIRVLLFGISLLAYFSASGEHMRGGGEAGAHTLRLLFPVALLAASIGCLDFWFQLPAPSGYGPQYIWLDSGVYRRAQGLFYESSTLGTFCAFFLVMIAVSVLQPRSKRILGAIALWAGVPIFGLALLLSYSRGAIIACAVALLALAVVKRRRWMNARILIGAVLCVAAVVVLLLLVFPEFAQSYWARIAFTFEEVLSRPDRVLSGRVDTWRSLAAFISAHPWQTIVGIGYKTLPYTEHPGRPVIADNMYLSALVETGLAGLAALIALNAAILRATWRAARNAGSFYATWIFCFWTGFTVQMLSGDVLTYWRILPVFFWVLGQAVREAEDANSPAGSVL